MLLMATNDVTKKQKKQRFDYSFFLLVDLPVNLHTLNYHISLNFQVLWFRSTYGIDTRHKFSISYI